MNHESILRYSDRVKFVLERVLSLLPHVTQTSDTCVSGEAAGRGKSGMEEARREKVVRKSSNPGKEANSNPGKEAAEILRAFPLLDFMASSLLVRSKK